MENSNIPYEERELIQRAIRNARPFAHAEPRWAMVKRVFGTGATVSAAICTRYGFDPNTEVTPLTRLSEAQFEENLLEHGIVR